MQEVEVITLEDGNTYMIIDEININGVRYVYLSNEEDVASFAVRKINIINNEEYLVSLSDKEEFNKALQYFLNKNNNS